jgi:MFS family permease
VPISARKNSNYSRREKTMTTLELKSTNILRRSTLSGLWLVAAMPMGILLAVAFTLPLGLRLDFENWTVQAGFILAYLSGGTLWGRAMGRVYARQSAIWRLAVGGALGVTVPMVIAVVQLTEVEQNLGRYLVRTGLPVHMLFGVSFSLAALFIAGAAGLTLGLALKQWRLAIRLGIGGGLAGSLAFVLLAWFMHLIGFRVGGPGAEQRGTMLLVSVLGMWAAALAGSGIIGTILAHATYRSQQIDWR